MVKGHNRLKNEVHIRYTAPLPYECCVYVNWSILKRILNYYNYGRNRVCMNREYHTKLLLHASRTYFEKEAINI